MTVTEGRKRESRVNLEEWESCDSSFVPQEKRTKAPAYLYNTEVSMFKILLPIKSFSLVATKFSNKFKCHHDSNKKLLPRDGSRSNADINTYTFICGCGTANFLLQFRHYADAVEMMGEKKHFVYQVFVKKEKLQDAVSHFNQYLESFETKNLLQNVDGKINIMTATELTKRGRLQITRKVERKGKRGRSAKKQRVEKNANAMKTKLTQLLYSHHHIEKCLEIPLLNSSVDIVHKKNMSSEKSRYTESTMFTPTNKKIQFVVDGQQLSVQNFCNGALTSQYPIYVIDTPESIGMKINLFPSTVKLRKVSGRNIRTTSTSDYISKIAKLVGNSTEVTIINVPDQQEVEGWTFGDLANYFNNKARTQVVNQVSFEFSDTLLAKYVAAPELVQEMDWIINAWPPQYQHPRYSNSISKSTKVKTRKKTIYYPLIQYYCVTSSAGAYMDFHIDIGGTSFWYHLVSGRKQFVLIEPTKENLLQYEKWIHSDTKTIIFLPYLIKDKSTIIHMVLNENETLFVPSGWIHAVYTPKDSVAFGGNYLQGYSTEMQIRINEMETRSFVAEKFRCPYFNISHVFAINMYIHKLQLLIASRNNNNIISIQELLHLPCLVEYIVCEYNVVLKSKINKACTDVCRAKYISVFEEPNFEDAIEFIVQDQNCITLKECLMKLYYALAELYKHNIHQDCYRKTTVSGSSNFPLQSIQIMRGEVALENTTILSDIDETGTLVTNKTFSTPRTTASQRFSYKCVIPELEIRISVEDRNIVKNLLDDARDKFNKMFRCVNNVGEIKKKLRQRRKKKEHSQVNYCSCGNMDVIFFQFIHHEDNDKLIDVNGKLVYLFHVYSSKERLLLVSQHFTRIVDQTMPSVGEATAEGANTITEVTTNESMPTNGGLQNNIAAMH